MKIWINNYQESLDLISALKKLNYDIKHILTASTLPVVQINDEMIIGYGNILRYFKVRITPSDGMVDILVSKTSAERRVGSTPTLETKCGMLA